MKRVFRQPSWITILSISTIMGCTTSIIFGIPTSWQANHKAARIRRYEPQLKGWNIDMRGDVNNWNSSEQQSQVPCNLRKILYSRLLALETYENLKAYHVGIRSIFPNYKIPVCQDLLASIYSHPNFIGSYSQIEALEKLGKVEETYLIFEEKGNDRGHFYVIHSRGFRHFSVSQKAIAGIDNGSNIHYPLLEAFLESTLVFPTESDIKLV